MEEPVAALVEEPLEEGVAVAVDFGGGTFDVAVISLSPDDGEVIGLKGAEIGGERFDEAL
jgi:molecular chaperone DnaK (HSP70)